jgi:hypothetical protein
MRDRPILLTGIIGREKAIMCAIANLLQALSDNFTESLFIADLVDQLMRADEDTGTAKGGETKDLACAIVSRRCNYMVTSRIVDSP